MTPLLTWLSGLLVAPVSAGLLTGILCYGSMQRDQKPPWSHAIASALAGMFSALWVIFRGEVLSPARWPETIPGQWNSFVMALAPTISLTTVTALVAVALYQDRFKRQLSRQQRRALSRQRHQRSWHRARWFHLFASSLLMVCLTCGLMLWYSGGPASDDSAVVPNYDAARNWNPRTSEAPSSQRPAARGRPSFDASLVGGFLWPICLAGLVTSGGWFAYTLSYWRGYARVKPRHMRDLLARHGSSASEH